MVGYSVRNYPTAHKHRWNVCVAIELDVGKALVNFVEQFVITNTNWFRLTSLVVVSRYQSGQVPAGNLPDIFVVQACAAHTAYTKRLHDSPSQSCIIYLPYAARNPPSHYVALTSSTQVSLQCRVGRLIQQECFYWRSNGFS